MPRIRQIFIAAKDAKAAKDQGNNSCDDNGTAFERRLYIIRRQIDRYNWHCRWE